MFACMYTGIVNLSQMFITIKVLEIGVQASGMCLGVAIMMLIALYEDSFGSIFVSSAEHTAS